VKDKRTLFTSFLLSDDEQKRGKKGKKSARQKKSRKLVVFLFTFCLCFLSFLNKEGQKKDNKARKGFEKKKG
jgi:hypothetical protein